MKNPAGINKQRLLKWLINVTLVFSLVAFSGNIAESKSCRQEPVKTEQQQIHCPRSTIHGISKTHSKRTVHSSINGFESHFLHNHQEEFKFCMARYEQEIETSLRKNFSITPIKKKQEVSLLTYYPTDNFKSDELRG